MKIAVYAICKDEAAHVQEFVENVKDADVIVIADTGSTDGTWLNDFPGRKRITLHHISIRPWRFDTARNVALALVPPDVDVCISLDLDERLEPGWREGIERAWTQFPDLTRLGVGFETAGFKEFIHNSRVHSRYGLVWKDPCHEYLSVWMSNDNEVVSRSVKIIHKPDWSKPRTRLPLLASAIVEEPWNRRRIFYYGRELVTTGNPQGGLLWLQKYMELHKASKTPDWWESEQAEAYIRLAEGVITEQSEAGQTTPQ